EGDERGRQPSFKVQDRRRFSASGEARADTDEERPDPTSSPPPADVGAAPDAAAGGEITFATFVFSLSTQALVHLGEIADPVDGAMRVHLDGARQIIDILAMLADKTRG